VTSSRRRAPAQRSSGARCAPATARRRLAGRTPSEGRGTRHPQRHRAPRDRQHAAESRVGFQKSAWARDQPRLVVTGHDRERVAAPALPDLQQAPPLAHLAGPGILVQGHRATSSCSSCATSSRYSAEPPEAAPGLGRPRPARRADPTPTPDATPAPPNHPRRPSCDGTAAWSPRRGPPPLLRSATPHDTIAVLIQRTASLPRAAAACRSWSTTRGSGCCG
jgi:hypothetical protein